MVKRTSRAKETRAGLSVYSLPCPSPESLGRANRRTIINQTNATLGPRSKVWKSDQKPGLFLSQSGTQDGDKMNSVNWHPNRSLEKKDRENPCDTMQYSPSHASHMQTGNKSGLYCSCQRHTNQLVTHLAGIWKLINEMKASQVYFIMIRCQQNKSSYHYAFIPTKGTTWHRL